MITTFGLLSVRWWKAEDLEQIEGLLQACYKHESWTNKDIQRFANKKGNRNYIKVIGDSSGGVYGVVLYSIDNDVLRLRRLAVWPENRRCGIATSLVRTMTGVRSPYRRQHFTAKVHERDLAGQQLLKGLGFTMTGKHGKDDKGEDVYLFEYKKAAVPAVI